MIITTNEIIMLKAGLPCEKIAYKKAPLVNTDQTTNNTINALGSLVSILISVDALSPLIISPLIAQQMPIGDDDMM